MGGLAQDFKGNKWWRVGHSFELEADSPFAVFVSSVSCVVPLSWVLLYWSFGVWPVWSCV